MNTKMIIGCTIGGCVGVIATSALIVGILAYANTKDKDSNDYLSVYTNYLKEHQKIAYDTQIDYNSFNPATPGARWTMSAELKDVWEHTPVENMVNAVITTYVFTSMTGFMKPFAVPLSIDHLNISKTAKEHKIGIAFNSLNDFTQKDEIWMSFAKNEEGFLDQRLNVTVDGVTSILVMNGATEMEVNEAYTVLGIDNMTWQPWLITIGLAVAIIPIVEISKVLKIN